MSRTLSWVDFGHSTTSPRLTNAAKTLDQKSENSSCCEVWEGKVYLPRALLPKAAGRRAAAACSAPRRLSAAQRDPRHSSAFQLGTAGTVHAIPLTQLCSCLSDQHSASSSVTWGTDQHGSMTQPPGSFGTAQPMDEASRSLPTTRRPSPYRQKAASGLP